MSLVSEANETYMFHEESELRKNADKELFVLNLGWLLSQTREGILGCRYLPKTEEVVVNYKNNRQVVVNVACDSYCAIVRDVMRALF